MSPPPSSASAATLPPPALVGPKPGEARAGLAMSVATFAMAAASAIQAVLYLSSFGTSGRTDGFFVAFALYTTIGVFSQSLRLTSVPLIVEPGARLTLREYAAALGLIGIPLLIVAGLFAGPLASILAPGLDTAGRNVTESALPVLGAATVLQLWAAGAATVLAVRGRFNAIAGSYIAGAASGLVAYLALTDTAGELVLGWSMLAMAVVTCGWMFAGLRVSGGLGPARGDLRLRALLGKTSVILGQTAIYLAFNVLFVITLSYASHAAVGDATVLSYAYLYASYLVAGTGMALGMSRIPEMTRGARAERRAVVRETVPQGFRYAMLLVAPALAGLVTAGAPLIHELFPSSLNVQGVASLREFAALLAAWTLAALLVNFLLPAMFALGRARLVNWLAVPLLALHIAVTALGSRLWGVEGAVAACWIAPACFGAVLLAMGGDGAGRALAREMGGDALRFIALAAAAYGIAEVIGTSVASGLAAAVLTGLIGSALYGAGLLLVARRQVLVLVRTLRPATA
jgi:putative peptidoglycan lipid II flippase